MQTAQVASYPVIATKKVLLAEPDPDLRERLLPTLERVLGIELECVDRANGLESRVLDREYHLVLTNARLTDDSALSSLARIRSGGATTPFIVYTSFSDRFMRVLVSDVDGAVLSSRVVDVDNLAALACSLVERARRRP